MIARDPGEQHRVSSSLELLFDLVFVVAVSQASGSLHQLWEHQRFFDGLTAYGMVFFAIWWAWMNFTWFASAYDTDDWLYRLTTIIQMAGALTMAAGAERAIVVGDYLMIDIGYVIMRIAMATQWLRAAAGDPERRGTCLRYAIGIIGVQTLWVTWVIVQGPAWMWAVLALLDVSVPIFAERHKPTTFHPAHVAERYGLFTLIVLGESILASANSIIEGLNDASSRGSLVLVAVSSLAIVAAMWWIYFDREQGDQLTNSLTRTLFWGYAHYFVFAAAAAFSAGVEVAVEIDTEDSELPSTLASLTVTIPLVVFMLASWVVLLIHRRDVVLNVGIWLIAGLLIASSFIDYPLVPAAVLMVCAAGLVGWRRGEASEEHRPHTAALPI